MVELAVELLDTTALLLFLLVAGVVLAVPVFKVALVAGIALDLVEVSCTFLLPLAS